MIFGVIVLLCSVLFCFKILFLQRPSFYGALYFHLKCHSSKENEFYYSEKFSGIILINEVFL